jgi:glycosyltransferase involved in cell wall biosynthesis
VKQQVPIIYVAHDFEYGRVRQVVQNPLSGNFVRYIEDHACKVATRILCVSESDMKEMQVSYKIPTEKLGLLPNTVDIDYFSETHTEYDKVAERNALGLNASSFLLLFYGRMDYSPNLDALHFILNELAPALTELRCSIEIIVAGARIPKRYLGDTTDSISFYSDVPDMRRFLAVADAVIVPVSIGGGTRLKILESFAAEVPVISTAKGAEGIDCRDGYHILIAQRTAYDFIDKLKLLAKNKNIRKKLISNAYNLMVQKYSVLMASRYLKKVVI